jgi:hypothetical protein
VDVSTESIVILVAVVAAIVAGMFSKIAGRVAGLLLVLGIIAWGAWMYSRGQGLAFFGQPISPATFYALLGVLTAYQVAALVLAVRARKRERAKRAACPACGASETTEEGGRQTCLRCHHSWS